MALKPCLDCGRPTTGRRCPEHQPVSVYDAEHQAERAAWQRHLDETGGITCRRAPFGLCVEADPVVRSGDPWDLGHPDATVSAPKAPEHRRCNRGAPTRRT